MKIEHVAMYVKDLEQVKWFFENYFGAKSNAGYHNESTDFQSYFLTFDDGARLEIMSKPGLNNTEKIGIHMVTFMLLFRLVVRKM